MKFHNVIRKGLVITGIAAAFILLPGSVKAQEITNTEFSYGPNVDVVAQPTVANQDTGAVNALPPTQVLLATSAISGSAETQQAGAQAPEPAPWVTFALALCAGLLATSALVTADRAARKMASTSRSYLLTDNA
jgi:hypothetical protein